MKLRSSIIRHIYLNNIFSFLTQAGENWRSPISLSSACNVSPFVQLHVLQARDKYEIRELLDFFSKWSINGIYIAKILKTFWKVSFKKIFVKNAFDSASGSFWNNYLLIRRLFPKWSHYGFLLLTCHFINNRKLGRGQSHDQVTGFQKCRLFERWSFIFFCQAISASLKRSGCESNL